MAQPRASYPDLMARFSFLRWVALASLVATGAGARVAAVAGSLEAVTAAASRDGVRVVDGEPGAHQAVNVIHFTSADVVGAHLIYQHADAVCLEDAVAILRLIERHAVLQSRATAASDEDAKPQLRVALGLQQLADFFRCCWGDGDERYLRLGVVNHVLSTS